MSNGPPTPDAVRLRSLDRSLPMALLRAREHVMRRFRPMLAEHDLTEQQWRVLRVLDDAGGPLSIGEVADRAFLHAPSLSRIVASLSERQLIRRRTDSSDARRAELDLTAAGRHLVDRVGPSSEAIYRTIEAEFGQDDLAALEAALARLTRLD